LSACGQSKLHQQNKLSQEYNASYAHLKDEKEALCLRPYPFHPYFLDLQNLFPELSLNQHTKYRLTRLLLVRKVHVGFVKKALLHKLISKTNPQSTTIPPLKIVSTFSKLSSLYIHHSLSNKVFFPLAKRTYEKWLIMQNQANMKKNSTEMHYTASFETPETTNQTDLILPSTMI
jgi:hypothetical protein